MINIEWFDHGSFISKKATSAFPLLLRATAMPAFHDVASDHYIFARDVQSQLTPSATQKTTLIVAGCYVIAIAILWYV